MIRLRTLCLLLLLTFVPAVPAEEPRSDAAGDPLPPGAVARLGTLRWRATSTISFAAFLPGDRELLTLSEDYLATIWDAATGRELRRFDVGGKTIPPMLAGRFPPLLTSGQARLTPDGKSLLCPDRTSAVHAWNVASGTQTLSLPKTARISVQAALSADGKQFANFGSDGTLNILDLVENTTSRSIRWPFAQNRIQTYRFAFSPDGAMLLHFGSETVNRPGKPSQPLMRPVVIVWDVATGKEQRRLTDLLPPGNVEDVHFGLVRGAVSPDARRLALALADGIALFDLDSGREIGRRREFGDRMQLSLLFSADGKSLIGTSGGGEAVAVWSAAEGALTKQFGKPVAPLPPGGMPAWTRPDRSARNLCLSADGRMLAWTEGAAVRLFDLETGRLRSAPAGHFSAVRAAQFAPDGRIVFTTGSEAAMQAWDATTGRPTQRTEVPRQGLSLLISTDGRLLITSDNNSVSARLLDAATGAELRKITWDSEGFGATFRLSPDAKTVVALVNRASPYGSIAQVCSSETGAKVGDLVLPPVVASGESLEAWTYWGIRRILFTPDSRLVAVSTEGHLTVWDLTRRRELQRIEYPAGAALRHAALSPDGRAVAMEFLGGELGVWELATGQRRQSVRAGQRPETASAQITFLRDLYQGGLQNTTLSYSPDGRLLAAADAIGTIRLFDMRTGREVGSFTGHRGPVVSLAFSPDGRRLVSGSTDTTALVWDVAPLRDRLAVPSISLSAARLDELWANLLDADAAKAYRAMVELASDPNHSVAFLNDHANPVVAPDAGV
ncbi:MAG: WD40 repeat domain-containing protein, partial [Gemmataceae bacterium]